MEIEINISKEELNDMIRERLKDKIDGTILEIKEDVDWSYQEFNGITVRVKI